MKYQHNIQTALDQLREREFRAGRYNPVIPFLAFPLTASSPAPGAQHATIADAMEEADADGTRSILDIERVDEEPDFCVAAPLSPDALEEYFGTDRPTRAMVDQNLDFLEEVERGHCVYVVTYKDGLPDAIVFAGYSFD